MSIPPQRDQHDDQPFGAPEPGQVGRVPYRWVAMGVVVFGTFMVVLDTTVVNLGLPALQREFHTIDGVEWVVTAYLAAVGVAQMLSGWAADRYGKKLAFIGALAIFTCGSVLCAASPTLPLLVAARVVQGLGGGLMLPVGMATIYELFAPTERGRALGYFGIALMAAPAIGPVLGGGLVESVGWRWLFLINVPIGLASIPVAIRLLRDTGFREVRPLDRAGLFLSGAALALLFVGLSRGGTNGWAAPGVAALVGSGAALLAAFIRHALRTPQPLVQMRMLANPVFAIGMVSAALMTIVQFSRLVYIPLELGSARGISELHIGLVMLPSALGVAATLPIGGRLTDRVGARLPASIGLALLAVSFWQLAHLQTDTALPFVAAVLFVGGLGAGLAMMAPNIVAMNSVPTRQVSQAAGLSSVTRQLSAAVGVAVLAAVYATIRPVGAPTGIATEPEIRAYNEIFLVAFGVILVAFVVAQFLPGKVKALALQEARRAEAEPEAVVPAVGLEA